MTAPPAALLEQVRHAHARCAVARCIVGVAGGPAAGKSKLARTLERLLNEEAGENLAGRIAMDGFHMTNQKLAERGLTSIKGSIATFEAPALLDTLTRVAAGQHRVTVPDYSRDLHDVIEASHDIAAEQIVIVEGNYLFVNEPLWSDIRALLSLRVFIDTDWPTCRRRLIERYAAAGRHPDIAAAKADTIDFNNYCLVQESKRFAHIVI